MLARQAAAEEAFVTRQDAGPRMELWSRRDPVTLFGAIGMSESGWNKLGEIFPWGTLVVNVVGSWIIGFFFTLTEPDGRLLVGTTARQFVMIGICGGFTTFSSFSLQTLNLARDGDWLRASANIVASVFLCLVAVWLGHIAAAALNR